MTDAPYIIERLHAEGGAWGQVATAPDRGGARGTAGPLPGAGR